MSGTKAIDKVLTVLKRLLRDNTPVDIDTLSTELDIPPATLYRHIAVLEHQGLLLRKRPFRKGQPCYSPGIFLLNRFEPQRFREHLKQTALPLVETLTENLQLTAHLGIFEDDMVTYLIKSGPSGETFFTRESTQLDAYCSGLGKVLLSNLTTGELENYFAGEPLPAITSKTITDKDKLRKEIIKAHQQGYAVDNEEFEEGLYCIATPVLDCDRRVLAALSVSSHSSNHLGRQRKAMITALQSTCEEITQALYT